MSHESSGASRFDLIVTGGGLTGLALACAVAGAGPRVLLIEQRALESTSAPSFDGRVTAIGRGSRYLLEAIGVWRHLEEAQPILDIEVGERHSPLIVHYDHREVGDEPLGHIVENRTLRRALPRRIGRSGSSAKAKASRSRSRAAAPWRPLCSPPPTAAPRRCAPSPASASCAGTTSRPASSRPSPTPGRTTAAPSSASSPPGRSRCCR
jgi:hypothetical protein